ncbi:BnaC03g72910D, partial [Brassica napus]
MNTSDEETRHFFKNSSVQVIICPRSDAEGANNLIPMEIALKVASKIRAREKFAAYIVIPMWPEGDPTNMFMQSILYWQYKTMQMMYQTIYKALVEAELDGQYEPQDYLNFFCLGTREASDETVYIYYVLKSLVKLVQKLLMTL